jgi:hypothetical protein
MGYTVAAGTVIRYADGTLRGGDPVPAGVLKAWGESGLKANIDAGSVVADAEPQAQRPRKERE